MTARRHRNIPIRGVSYRDADQAAAALGVTATTIRAHARAGTLDRVGLGRSGVEPMPVRVRGREFPSPDACAAHFDVTVNVVYKRLAEGRPDLIGLPRQSGMYKARPITIGPLCFASMAQASRELGFSEGYVHRAIERDSSAMKQRILAAAMKLADQRRKTDCNDENSGVAA